MSRTHVLAGVALLTVGTAVGAKVLPSMLAEPDTTLPDELVGVWKTTDREYADRAFELTKTTVLFRTGTGEDDVDLHEITAIETSSLANGTLYTISYADGTEFPFIYQTTPAGIIRFQHQQHMVWRKDEESAPMVATPQAVTVAVVDSSESATGADSSNAPQQQATQPDLVGTNVRSQQSSETDSVGTDAPSQQSREMELVREVFSYRGSGRDPFRSLLQSGEVRPLLQDLRVTTITYDVRYPGNSVAVLRDTVVNKAYPVRIGDELGRLRVLQIAPSEVVLMLEEFGAERQVVLRQRRRMPESR